ncbi:bis(5'-nucleosyl)-tetraphosphatase (symmetrical) YqeK [Lysinibacillus irui]|uniref:bis(5'-nucleosyl)-tetraphosphatase (symmetrical) n=1 Tax=Lysinibacillus irui TaxID=2998077 RepID=A0AAJ5RLV9_9BACI|nr:MULTISPECIES: bis(5'-nucleosyl)-tetraphosphatase (symmetrical) YqeK [Lysinibacillus]MEA0555012.1 bis(5'-nucleosyl)-tetraphosphatase (symmetrical) YqeK [Lysinibacillus irui]MEA0565665.1 bis(5'-nucleosyl)-tetraphosphatase (symmetrical) YqeK [Lysinibacillus irui]MEA0976727.1 bis(5'-nucleosyl)-tetraphosphatase (symmetrical) YqeK [Lysinibacillus irui]MEA1042881.1 bis(5'-nucleosyl)-tetraphosphatase (symmetrical) YqeK [Lysinibacillus irui]WDV05643.1 bis(5'-nucleosyl)-tetraphosphatase (symmetrical)
MEREQYLAAIKPRMPEKRYVHTIGVMETAISLAQKYGEDAKKAETAAILHDIAKYADIEWMEDIVREKKLDPKLIGWGSELLHGPVGAYIAESEFGITDQEILNAIRFHTTGRASMSRLEKIIFVADMIEPNRRFEGVDRLRKKAQKNLDKAMSACVRHTLAFLIDTKQPIFPLSIECYNDMMNREDSEG